MKKRALAVALMCAAAPVVAQSSQPAGPPAETPPTPPTDQSQAPAGTTTTPPVDQPAPTAPPADPAASTTTTTTTTTTASTEAADPNADKAKAAVSEGWAKYDANKNDNLNRAEFGKWVSDLQSAAGEKKPTQSYLRAAFTTADADKSGSVTKEELETFLKG